ncbi:ComF family protein [Streptomyces thermoalcalitolerans]|uniref:ComF family protein n=1 Tax=Streptomyces thermoalcalitolerans TaxID=65605 RepID=A0ABP4A7H9_9ACTN
MRGWWQDLTDLVLPAECGGCGRPRTVLCPSCRAALSGSAPRRVRPVPEPPGLPAVHAAAPYADAVRAVLLAHKERGALALARPLGTALAGAVRAGLRAAAADTGTGPGAGAGAGTGTGTGTGAAGAGPSWTAGGTVLLVPVPSARRAVRARGHDPTRRIALAAAGELRRSGTPARVLAVLRQRRAVADQSRLNSRQRLDNLAGALEVAGGGAGLLLGGPVVLVDDLMTTGASLTEAARVVNVTVYARRAWEGMGQRKSGARQDPLRKERNSMYGALEIRSAYGVGDVICAAVVAASPDSFEMNRN